MKHLLLTALFSVILLSGIMAQQSQSAGNLTITIESTRVIGDQLLVSGQVVAKQQETRMLGLRLDMTDGAGDKHDMKAIWWGGKKLTSMVSFDQKLQPGIPYSFDLAIETRGRSMASIKSLLIDTRDWGMKEDLKFHFTDIPIPIKKDPNLTPGIVEVSKDVYLKWTKFEESATDLKINFVIENKASMDQEINFRSFSNTRVIDKAGNVHEGTLSIRDWVNFPVKTPIAVTITIKGAVKMSDVKMLQFESMNFKYHLTDLAIPK